MTKTVEHNFVPGTVVKIYGNNVKYTIVEQRPQHSGYISMVFGAGQFLSAYSPSMIREVVSVPDVTDVTDRGAVYVRSSDLTVEALNLAIGYDAVVTFMYVKPGQEPQERIVRPLELAKGELLVAYDLKAADIRSFRIDRIDGPVTL